MRVLFMSAEVAPFAKAGGLADVALALPRALSSLDIETAVVMPKYRMVDGKTKMTRAAEFAVRVGDTPKPCVAWRSTLPDSAVPIFFLEHDPYFDRAQIYGEGSEYPDALERFTFLSRGALALCDAMEWTPDMIHAHDWHTALAPGWLRDGTFPRLRSSRSLLTIHNLAYQGSFDLEGRRIPGLSEKALTPYLCGDRINLLRGGILSADLVNTVSPSYAREILDRGDGLEADLHARRDDLYGVLNGIDTSVWNPQTDPHLWVNYSIRDLSGKAENKRRLQRECGFAEDPRTPLIGMISRLAEQKGFDLMIEAFDRLLELGIQFVLLGTGDAQMEQFFREAAARHPQRVSAMLTFSETWAHRIEAAADIFLMPSRFEPCGLNQQYSLRYGTVPVVRATGGLRDTVIDADAKTESGNGFVFEPYDSSALLGALQRAVIVYRDQPARWAELIRCGMGEDRSWKESAKAYVRLYETALRKT